MRYDDDERGQASSENGNNEESVRGESRTKTMMGMRRKKKGYNERRNPAFLCLSEASTMCQSSDSAQAQTQTPLRLVSDKAAVGK